MCLLFVACQADVTGVEELLRSGEDIDSIDLEGCTTLHIVAYEGQGEVVRMCLSGNDASPVPLCGNGRGCSPVQPWRLCMAVASHPCPLCGGNGGAHLCANSSGGIR
jgi:ankyrin repeat protein